MSTKAETLQWMARTLPDNLVVRCAYLEDDGSKQMDIQLLALCEGVLICLEYYFEEPFHNNRSGQGLTITSWKNPEEGIKEILYNWGRERPMWTEPQQLVAYKYDFVSTHFPVKLGDNNPHFLLHYAILFGMFIERSGGIGHTASKQLHNRLGAFLHQRQKLWREAIATFR